MTPWQCQGGKLTCTHLEALPAVAQGSHCTARVLAQYPRSDGKRLPVNQLSVLFSLLCQHRLVQLFCDPIRPLRMQQIFALDNSGYDAF
jgi:hypothetical protein